MDTEAQPDEPSEPDTIECEDEASYTELCNRHLLKPIRKLIETSEGVENASPRVQFTLDQMVIAACERAVRILRSDLEGDVD